jgi:hypothetical protein
VPSTTPYLRQKQHRRFVLFSCQFSKHDRFTKTGSGQTKRRWFARMKQINTARALLTCSTARSRPRAAARKRSPSFECFSLSLSRACLGKVIIFVLNAVGEHSARFFSYLLLEEKPLGVGGRPTAVGRNGWRARLACTVGVHRLLQKHRFPQRLFHLAFDLSVSWQMIVSNEKVT